MQAALKPEVHVVSGPTAAGSCADVPGPRYHQPPYRCTWFGLQLKAMLMSESMLQLRDMSGSVLLLQQKAVLISVGHTATGDHAEVQNVLIPRPGGCVRPVLSPETVCTSIICAPATVKGKEAPFAVVLMTAGAWLRRRDIGGFSDNLYPTLSPTPKKKQPRQKATKENS